jgi:hypothetical protein
MSDSIPIGATKTIRDCGFDEVWLQDQIADNPNCLQLGDLELASRERQQSSGGRLDILLKDPQDDTMFEVEVMLGESDESHIIRTIEYWDREKRRWPQRQHYAVLVAESITRRFFNVIQLLSISIPIIAVQVNIVEANGNRVLHFTKVMDTYEEPEDDSTGGGGKYDEDFWRNKSPWTLDAALELISTVKPAFDGPKLNYVKNYIAIEVNGNNYLWLRKRSGAKSLLGLWLSETNMPKGTELLDGAGITYVAKGQNIRLRIDKQFVKTNAECILKLAHLVKTSWTE